ncbi:alpha/beta fold hydrolase [Alcanivorax sp. DP30]|uniref:alpha/beta fold hydrolase n=1 Tax=Alcanivorax sp. DP30 TaxID=2606217 RepID=UPI001367C4AE|nr:alpha/beta hydrolase [Alcanivorax sp. DP30]MZR61758.1 alpha/beta fold hydrolase [Alcanivorax sp. DP30]
MARTWVLLRGLVREQKHWEDFPAKMQAALPNDRVITLDLPGNGIFYDQPSPTRIGAMVIHAREQLKEQGLQGPYHLVALSLGGMTAVQWLSQAPKEVAFAALINTSSSRFNPFWQRLRPANYLRLIRDGILNRDRVRKEQAILEITSNLHDRAFLHQLAEKWAEYARLQPVSITNSLRQLVAAMRFRAPSSLPSSVPTIIISGGGDRLVNPVCSRRMAEAWQLPLKVQPQAGHDLPLDAPQWLINTLIEGVTESAI